MMKKYDIANLFNHKLIYDTAPETKDYGIDNVYVLRRDFNLTEDSSIDNNYIFSFGENTDNFVCSNQEITIDEYVEYIHFIGFSIWGESVEYVQILYEDGEKSNETIVFTDWSADKSVQEHFFHDPLMKTTIGACLTSGVDRFRIFFHHFEIKVKKDKKIKKIILPDNMFIHVFAVSAEICD